jgi:hypothetical protein
MILRPVPKAICQGEPMLSLAEVVLYLDGDIDLAREAVRDLRIAAYREGHPVRVPLDRLEAWLRRHRHGDGGRVVDAGGG